MAYDRNAFLMYFAGFTSEFPALVAKFEKIYQQDKTRFYTLACKNPRYSANFLNDKNLIQDVASKRIFGVYLASDEDEQIRTLVCEILFSFEPGFKKYQKEFKAKQIECAQKTYSKIRNGKEYANNASKGNFVFYAAHYLTGEEEYSVEFDIRQRDGFDPERLKKFIDEIDVFDHMEIEPGDWKIIKKIISDNEIQTLLKIPEMVMTKDNRTGELMGHQFYLDWEKDVENGEREQCWGEMVLTTGFLAALFEYYGLSITKVFRNVRISKAERDIILRLCAHCAQQMNIVNKNQDDVDFSLYCQDQISVSEYYTRFLFFLLIRNFVETKRFYYENNNETLFSQVSIYREENERLIKELEEAKKKAKQEKVQSELLRKQIVEKTQYLSKDEKELLKPYQEEISLLRKQIVSLETALEEEREKDSELHALREFAFEAKSEYISTDSKISLSDLMKQKKLVVIGGHIEWRNKLKAKYPNIMVVDGHNAGSDFSMLTNTDIVLLNVSNMSHSVYYKAINILRSNKIRFDYLGRTINQELYEQEIRSILEKHGF